MVQYEKAQTEVSETYDFYKAVLEDRMQELQKELESTYKNKQVGFHHPNRCSCSPLLSQMYKI